MPIIQEPLKEWFWVLACPFIAFILALPLAYPLVRLARYILWNTGNHMPGKAFLATVSAPIVMIVYTVVLVGLILLGLRRMRRRGS